MKLIPRSTASSTSRMPSRRESLWMGIPPNASLDTIKPVRPNRTRSRSFMEQDSMRPAADGSSGTADGAVDRRDDAPQRVNRSFPAADVLQRPDPVSDLREDHPAAASRGRLRRESDLRRFQTAEGEIPDEAPGAAVQGIVEAGGAGRVRDA